MLALLVLVCVLVVRFETVFAFGFFPFSGLCLLNANRDVLELVCLYILVANLGCEVFAPPIERNFLWPFFIVLVALFVLVDRDEYCAGVFALSRNILRLVNAASNY